MESVKTFEDFQTKIGRQWRQIVRSRKQANEVLELLKESLKDLQGGDVECVFFGSLARREWTSGSDVDWTLLVDGQSTASHFKTAQAVAEAIASVQFQGKPLSEPGASGLFGSLTFSHQLVHKLGGEQDTNLNTTRRILLLLESTGIREEAHQRTLRAILDRYLRDDFRFDDDVVGPSRVPRFLLNDIFRFWRTLCVDYGMKRWTQNEKWALRNIKLRISRKWLFLAGVLTMFTCESPEVVESRSIGAKQMALDILTEYAALTPSDIIARTLCGLDLQQQAAELFNIYDAYLTKLDNPDLREYLKKLTTQAARRDVHFREFKELGRSFQDSLKRVFFEQSKALSDFIREYGVF